MASLKNEYERRNESLNIIYQLQQLGFNSKDEAIHKLIELLTVFIETGINCDINIPFLSANKTIMGSLYNQKNKDCKVFFRENNNN